MASTVIVRRHDGTEARYVTTTFEATDTVYLIEDTDGVTWFERKCDVRDLTTEFIEKVVDPILH